MGFTLMSSTTEEAGLVGFLGHGQPENFFHFCDGKSIGVATETVNQHQQPPAAAPLVCSTINSSPLTVEMMGYAAPSSVGLPEQVTTLPAHLADILEHALDQEQLDSMSCASQLPHEQSIAADANSLSSSSLNMLPQAKSNLIRHSSSPADFLSMVMDEMNGQPLQFHEGDLQPMYPCKPLGEGGSSSFPKVLPQVVTMPCFSIRDCLVDLTSNHNLIDKGNNVSISDVSSSGLLRQSSSPAGLLSQLSVEEMANAGYIHDIATGSFGQRKRARELDAKMLQVSLTKGALGQQRSPTADIMIPTSCSSPRSHTENMELSSIIDSVLCKARAKRGCATHPRSIAERVRRTKISERMKKLQDLVPNLDKQASTAEMLDEVVEYVKLLQRQVQELGKQTKCNGLCREKLNCD